MKTWSDEDLMAHADGELPAEEGRALEKALAGDDALRRRVDRFRADRAVLRRAFDERRLEPVPDRLMAAFDRPAGRRFARRVWMAPLALAAMLVLGIGIALWFPRAGDTTVLPAPALLSAALESTASGLPHAVVTGAIREELVPLRTVRLGDGTWCREFSFARFAGADPQVLRALACRGGAGAWGLRMLLPNSPAPRAHQYTLAGEEAELPGLGSFQTVPIAREHDLIESHWE